MIGPIDVDQRQPGSNTARPTAIDPILASWDAISGKLRSSSGSSKLLLRINPIYRA